MFIPDFKEKNGKRPHDGLYQAESSHLKNLYCKAVYDCVLNNIQCFNFSKMKDNLLYIGLRPYRTVNTFHHGYKNQPGDDV